MTPFAIALITLSTFAHAFWNLLGKRRSPSTAFFGAASLAAGVCLLPVAFFYGRAIAGIPPAAWALLAATGVFQALYYTALAGAYRGGDLSVAYPLARALPALLVTLVTGLLGLGSPLGPAGYIGVALVVAGCLLIPLRSLKEARLSNYLNATCALALLAACGTTGYTIIDSEALARLRAAGLSLSALDASILWMALETFATTLVLGAYIAANGAERRALADIRRTGWAYPAVTGLIITATYGLVLSAMAYVTNVSYLAAFRELSIPLGALLGITVQKEPAYPLKLAGIGVVLAGLLMVGLGH